MPELPEVETTVRGLAPFLDGQRLVAVTTFRPDLRRPFPADLAQRLTGATVTGLSRRAKYGIISTDRDDHMIFHLGMSGRWRTEGGAVGKHDHLLLETAAGHRLFLHDPRRFGSVDLVSGDPLAAFPAFVTLGPETLSDAFDAIALARALAGRRAPIKAMLLDQTVVAGLGNIYVCEALNMARISPLRAAADVPKAKLDRLVPAIKQVLASAIAAGGSTLRDFLSPEGDLGYFAKEWRVYGRESERCECGGTIRRTVQAGRSTFHCPKCQR
ncbi:MAG: bifunctional DNA-formamidopyrimidine glycosylase/DNA-(apurinic or apyrimidinic site) lyase [Sphingopyxis sp.]|uniref:bifunctional DNA-formamidopyrimidine glycosylase/DNA-(apurinic or apyrimidinic site) lyase n=1 Tax=Sphingopyxis sp. TaxID=1908224 RepID=UPI002ABA7690|nr:bifunctional DNA-formamidopyrimidine glycosylase/DNA-(apurinic or apyrimidinic site) lyase [Sphingopyxis sp.]MDZ3830602.1 bifunctional DNA-formamidopyrimidine glycosylase/DNA-(apurinic or apyrimidinic site) lyase [Sphingopyxis sp.]